MRSELILLLLLISNKKVFLRERNRHTACSIASTCYAVPVGGTPCLGRGTPTWEGGNPCLGRVPPLGMGVTPTWEGLPPTWTWEGGIPPPGPGKGYPSAWIWEGGTPCRCEQTETREHINFVLRTRAVKMDKMGFCLFLEAYVTSLE